MAHLQLTQAEREWIKRKWGLVRKSQQEADRASSTWNQLNEELNDYLDRKGEMDIVQRAKIKGQNLPLADALARGNWHSRNAERHIHDVNLFLKLKGMGLL
jgi:hypothetical protein